MVSPSSASTFVSAEPDPSVLDQVPSDARSGALTHDRLQFFHHVLRVFPAKLVRLFRVLDHLQELRQVLAIAVRLPLHRGDQLIYAGDAGRGLVRASEQGRPGERYLLTGENISMAELVTRIAQIAGAPVPRAIPLPVARVASALQTARYRWLKGPVPRVDAAAIAVMSAGQFMNGAKARSELGFTATETLDNAITRALAWFRSNGYVKPN
jgi:nucleoside-diphosphate-sugar epimerase